MNGVKLGLTGTIGSGKSTALSFLAEQGWRGIRTDHLAREEMEKPEIVEQLRGRWGNRVFQRDGSLDRSSIAGIVFAREEELDWLESLLHPQVRKRWEGIVASDPEKDHVVEIPLLFEKNLASRFDFVVSLSCPEPLQKKRLIDRGLSAEDIEARKLRQYSASEKESRADFVISNCGTLLFLEKQVLRLSDKIRGATLSKS